MLYCLLLSMHPFLLVLLRIQKYHRATQVEGCGYELVFKEVSFEDDKVKGNIDAELIFTGMLWYNDYDKAIIISGDGDFIVFLKHLKEHKKLLKVILPNAFRHL